MTRLVLLGKLLRMALAPLAKVQQIKN